MYSGPNKLYFNISSVFRITFLCLILKAHPSIGREDPNRSRTSPFNTFHFSESESEERILSALSKMSHPSNDNFQYSEWFSDYDNEGRQCLDNATTDQSHQKKTQRKAWTSNEKSKRNIFINDRNLNDEANERSNDAKSFHFIPVPESYRHNSNRTERQEKESSKNTTSSFMSITTPWVRKYLAYCYRDALLPVPRDYWLDNFNLAHLPPVIERIAGSGILDERGMRYPTYKAALHLIVSDEPIPTHIPDHVQRAAVTLYHLVHQRYVLSPRGFDMIRRRFLVKPDIDPIFGRCPRLSCQGMPLLPYGDSNDYDPSSRCKRYCGSCREIFYHWESQVDGCAWGNSFCHLFLMTFGKELFGNYLAARKMPVVNHTARIFDFSIHPSVTIC